MRPSLYSQINLIPQHMVGINLADSPLNPNKEISHVVKAIDQQIVSTPRNTDRIKHLEPTITCIILVELLPVALDHQSKVTLLLARIFSQVVQLVGLP